MEVAADPYHTLLGAVSPEKSLSTVLGLPLSYFFDVIKGTYRVGILGGAIQNSHPDLVQLVSRRVFVNGETIMMNDVPTVDVPLVFTHVLAAVQVLAGRADELRKSLLVGADGTEEENSKLMTAQYQDLLAAKHRAMEWRQRPKNVSLLLDTMTARVKTQELRLAGHEAGAARRKLSLAAIEQARKELHLQHHQILLGLANDAAVSLATLYIPSTADPILQESAGGELGEAAATDEMLLQKEHVHQLARLEQESNLDIEMVMNRTREISRMERINEPTAARLLKVEHELVSKETSQLVDAIFNEFGALTARTFSDGRTTLKACLAIVIFLVVLAAVLELAPAVRAVLASISRSYTANTYGCGSRVKVAGSLDAMTLSSSTKESLLQLGANLRGAAQTGAKLPYILFCGEAGTGKTMAARAVAQDSGLAVSALCGADLEALGLSAGLHLRQLLDGAARGRGGKTLVIIDEADSIIASREYSETKTAASPCLFSLLQAMREGSSNLCIIITTRKKVHDIDSALLDRLDTVEYFAKPGVQQRLEFGLRRCVLQLERYFREGETQELRALLQTQHTAFESSPFESVVRHFELSAQLLREHAANRSISPEMDRPMGNASATLPIMTQIERELKIMVSSSLSTPNLEVKKALNAFLLASVTWSYRDLDKFFTHLQTSAMSTHECCVTQKIWLSSLLTRVTESLTIRSHGN